MNDLIDHQDFVLIDHQDFVVRSAAATMTFGVRVIARQQASAHGVARR
jgi:hypothetical protein